MKTYERLLCYYEKQQLIVGCQSGFRNSRRYFRFSLEDAVRKTQVNAETVAAVCFGVEEASKCWKEGLLIVMGIRKYV